MTFLCILPWALLAALVAVIVLIAAGLYQVGRFTPEDPEYKDPDE